MNESHIVVRFFLNILSITGALGTKNGLKFFVGCALYL